MNARSELISDVFEALMMLAVGAIVVFFVIGVIVKWPWGFVGALIGFMVLGVAREIAVTLSEREP